MQERRRIAKVNLKLEKVLKWKVTRQVKAIFQKFYPFFCNVMYFLSITLHTFNKIEVWDSDI